MGMGPRAGLAEIALPETQPGSSIMPGKVNPVIVESLTMVVARVVGNDATIAFGQTGSLLELNVMLPVTAVALLESITLLAAASRNFADRCVDGLTATERGPALVEQGLMLATALAPEIGYDAAAALAKEAFKSGRTIRELATRARDRRGSARRAARSGRDDRARPRRRACRRLTAVRQSPGDVGALGSGRARSSTPTIVQARPKPSQASGQPKNMTADASRMAAPIGRSSLRTSNRPTRTQPVDATAWQATMRRPGSPEQGRRPVTPPSRCGRRARAGRRPLPSRPPPSLCRAQQPMVATRPATTATMVSGRMSMR